MVDPPPGTDKEAERAGKIKISFAHTRGRKRGRKRVRRAPKKRVRRKYKRLSAKGA